MGTQMLQRRGTDAEWAAANPILGDGEFGYDRNTREIRMGDGVTHWVDLPSTNIYIPKSTLDALYSPIGAIPVSIADAAGDLLVGSAPDVVVRLPMGTPGQQLKVKADGSGLFWETPPATDLSSRVAKTGDSMSGRLQVTDLGVVTGTVLNIRQAATATKADVDAGRVDGTSVYDSGNRVYSQSNPPPGAGTVVSVTGTYAVAAGVGVILANGTFTTTLPSAVTFSGRVINIKNTGIGVITVASAAGTIDGAATVALNTQYASITVVSDGANWFII